MRNFITNTIVCSSIVLIISCTGNTNATSKNSNTGHDLIQKTNVQIQQMLSSSSNNLSWHNIGQARFSAAELIIIK